MVGRRNHAVFFHLFHQFGGFVISNPQFALDIAGRTFAVACHDGHGLVVKPVIKPVATKAQKAVNFGRVLVFGAFDDALFGVFCGCGHTIRKILTDLRTLLALMIAAILSALCAIEPAQRPVTTA